MRLPIAMRKELTKNIAAKYRRAGKKERGQILDGFVESTGYNRSYAGWLLRGHGRRVQVRPGLLVEGDAHCRVKRERARRYGPEVVAALKEVWEILDCIAGKRLAAALPEVVARLVACGELRISEEVQELLVGISPATIDRLLKEERAKYKWKRRGGTKPGTLLKHQVPIRTFSDWEQVEPGFLEMDLVAHDGGLARGEYCHTLDVTDVATGWTEQMAVPNKAQVWVFQALERLRQRLPFQLRGLDSDNGGEFINHHLQSYCQEHKLAFTRSRPYRKNDTCFVEQKNWSVVRRFVGYGRYSTERTCRLLNDLYALLRDYNNFFLPSMKLKEKTRDGARVHRRYEPARTPYQRMLQSPVIPQAAKNQLRRHYRTLNPAALHRRIRRLQEQLQKMAARPGRTAELAQPGIAASAGPDGQTDGQAFRLCPQLDHRPLDNSPGANAPSGYPQPLGKLRHSCRVRSFPQPPPSQKQDKNQQDLE